MDINELLSIIQYTAESNDLSKPFIVGGVPRDRIIEGTDVEISDVDITTGDEDSTKLGELLAKRLPEAKHKTFDDGHSTITFRGLRIDLSSNFVAPGIDAELKKAGVTEITPMKREIYSRDFTINTLLEELDFSRIYDITGVAEDDIKARLLRCPIDPEITIGVDPRRILRALKFHLKYDFKIEDELRRAMLNHRKKIETLPQRFVQDKMSEIVRLDNDAGIEALIEYKLLPLVPLSKEVANVLIQRRELARAF